jgi:hypothetical protein
MRACPAGLPVKAHAPVVCQVSNIRLRPSPQEDIGATEERWLTTSPSNRGNVDAGNPFRLHRLSGEHHGQQQMALIACHDCGNQVSTTARACPQCGADIKARGTRPNPSPPISSHRNVSIPLIIGIILMPYFFAWFLLREGYSKQSRMLGLGWLVLVVVIFAISQRDLSSADKSHGSTSSKVDVDPARADKDLAAARARSIVPSALKDPSSAEFENVWGVSATVACGLVNAKNSFGALAGKTRFILEDGRVAFESGQAGFARHWNSVCVSKPLAPPPTGAGGIRWGARPSPSLKQFEPATDEGLAIYVPKGTPEHLDGVTVAEADYEFDHGRLFAANFYIDGEAARDAILAAYLKKYGTPQTYDEDAGTYAWKWPTTPTSLNLNYDAKHGRSTVNFNHK